MAVETRFPRWSDSPPQVFNWEMDELIPVVLCFVLSLPTRNLLLGLIIGVVIMKVYVKLKDKLPSYFYLHYLWYWGIWSPKIKSSEALKGYLTTYRE